MKWHTKEGQFIEISKMASSHLLSAIHMIERNRFQNLASVQATNGDDQMVEYYSKWPPAYAEMLEEAERRYLIGRVNHKTKGLVHQRGR